MIPFPYVLRRRMMVPSVVARLPKEYQEVEYIQSSGTQYIDTGVVATSGFEMETKIAITATSEYYAVICGAHELSAPYKRNFVAYAQTVGKMEIDAGDIITQTAVSLNSGANIIKASNISNNFSLSINDVPYSVSGGGATTAYSSRTLYLLYCNGYELGAPITGKLYYHKMYTGGALVRDLVPCYRKSDKAAGMYDLVYGVFYGNAGTGSFAVGPNVNNAGSSGGESGGGDISTRTVTLTGEFYEGHAASYHYGNWVVIDGNVITTAGTYKVNDGSTIYLYVGSGVANYVAEIIINGTTVYRTVNPTANAASYALIVTSNITIQGIKDYVNGSLIVTT